MHLALPFSSKRHAGTFRARSERHQVANALHIREHAVVFDEVLTWRNGGNSHMFADSQEGWVLRATRGIALLD
jgi:hypothetical protein